jgi:tetratricopeptide (TPR) repeat protein
MKNIQYIFLFLFIWACKNEPKQQAPQYGKTGNPQIDALTERIFKDPKNANLYFQRAQLFYKNGEQGGYDYAIEDMKYALSIDSNNIQYHDFLSDCYMDYAQSDLAIATMERAADIAPNDIKTLQKLSEYYLITKQYPKSLEILNRILKQDAQNAGAYFMMGMIAKEQKDTTRAINAFQKSADIDPSSRDAFIELGRLYTAKGNPLALKYLDNALVIDSLDYHAMMAKGYYYQVKNDKDKAIEAYKKILVINPRYGEALFNLGLIYLENDDLVKAKEHFNIVIQEAPNFYKAYYYRGFVSEKEGDKLAALKDYKQSLVFKADYQNALEGVKRVQ